MRRGVLILLTSVAAIGLLTGGLAWLLTDTRPPAGATRAQRLYYAYCVECHGVGGRGSWRGERFFLPPRGLPPPPRASPQSRRLPFVPHQPARGAPRRPAGPAPPRRRRPGRAGGGGPGRAPRVVGCRRRARPAGGGVCPPAPAPAAPPRYRSRSTQTSTISSPLGRTASRTRSPGDSRAASSFSG